MKDRSDIEALIESEIPGLRRFAYALTGRPDLADDLVQDALERSLRKLHQWRRQGSIRQWLRAIVYRTFLNGRRGAQFQAQKIPIDDIDYLASVDDPHMSAELADTLKRLGKLQGDRRIALLLVAVEGLSYSEAAKVMNTSIGTIRSRVSRARVELYASDEEEIQRPNLVQVK